jgi:hypothetical protein
VAVAFSAVGFLIKSSIDTSKERREYQRRVEVGITMSLNQMLEAREQLRYLSEKMKKSAARIRSDRHPKTICLDTVNFPAISEIYNNYDAIWYKPRSYYLHNYLLFSIRVIVATNAQIADFRETLAHIERDNNLLVDRMIKTGLDAQAQKDTYAENIETLCNGIEGYISNLKQVIIMLLRVKIYNNHIRSRFGWYFYWQAEGRSFKYFRDRASYNAYSRTIELCDRIDAIIESEVNEELNKLESKAPQLLIKIQ